jgi:hypothetical protein
MTGAKVYGYAVVRCWMPVDGSVYPTIAVVADPHVFETSFDAMTRVNELRDEAGTETRFIFGVATIYEHVEHLIGDAVRIYHRLGLSSINKGDRT